MTRSTRFGSFQRKFGILLVDSRERQSWRAWAALCAVLAFTWLCYQPAITGPFQFDDNFNLRGLATIEDARSAAEFIFTGIAGPTGRPLALASFAFQAEQWELGASAFLRVNILIHIINALLVAICSYWLSLQRNVDRDNSALIAVVAATLWALMPLHATASLLVVQRMTTLSATFLMLGMCGYLFARSKMYLKPKLALIGMTASLVGGTIMSGLCKETGFLLPVFVLVLEMTILRQPNGANSRLWRIWQSVFLVLPLVLLLAYFITWLDYSQATLSSRGFNAWERLLTEGRILWIYLSKAVAGLPSRIGLYQSPPNVSHSLLEPATFLACVAWTVLLFAAITWRRRFPLFAVSVLWFIGGHLIESTVIPLELYFEHRNYMPMVGPLFGLSSCIVLHPRARWRQVAGALVAVLAMVNAWFLYSFATLSGDPALAVRYWANNNPTSERAVLRMATYQLLDEGPTVALQTIDSFIEAYPEHAYMRIPQLNLMCQMRPDLDLRKKIELLERELRTVEYSNVTTWLLTELVQTTERIECNGVDATSIASLAESLHHNPRYADQPSYNDYYYRTLAYFAYKRGDYDAVVQLLEQAIEYGQPRDLNVMMVMALGNAGKYDNAREFIDNAEGIAPAHPVKAAMWRRDLNSLREYIRKLERNANAADRRPDSMEKDSERS